MAGRSFHAKPSFKPSGSFETQNSVREEEIEGSLEDGDQHVLVENDQLQMQSKQSKKFALCSVVNL